MPTEWGFVALLAALLVAHYGLRKAPLVWHVHAFMASLFAFGLFRNTVAAGIGLGCMIGIGHTLFHRAILDKLGPGDRKAVRYVALGLVVAFFAARSFWPAAFALTALK